MQDASLRESIRRKYLALAEDLDERGRRRWAATEARDLGWGGITLVAAATGLSDRTTRNGLEELDAPQPLRSHRQRREGGGRKPHRETQPKLLDALDRLLADPYVERSVTAHRVIPATPASAIAPNPPDAVFKNSRRLRFIVTSFAIMARSSTSG